MRASPDYVYLPSSGRQRRAPATGTNGNQKRVRDAIYAGARTIDDIMQTTGLTQLQIQNALKRIKDVRRAGNRYVPTIGDCLLADVWK